MAQTYERLFFNVSFIIMHAAKRLDWSPKKRAVTLQKEGYSYRKIAPKMGQGVSTAGVLKQVY